MQDSARGSAAAGERASVQGSNVAATGRSRRRWSAEEKARVVRESLRPGKRVGEVARRYARTRIDEANGERWFCSEGEAGEAVRLLHIRPSGAFLRSIWSYGSDQLPCSS